MLGTLYAMRVCPDGGGFESRYFDYEWEEAFEWAGVSNDRDPRLHKNKRRVNWIGAVHQPSKNKLCLWLLPE